MARHLVEGARRIARGDRFVDCGVVANRKRVGVGHVIGGGALVDEPVDDRLVDHREDRIARDHGDLVVEGDIGADEFDAIADGGDVGVEGGFQLLDILLGGNGRGQPGNASLKHEPRLLAALLSLRPGGETL